MTLVLLVVGAFVLGWIGRDLKAAGEENAAFHRGVRAGRQERTGFRTIEEIQEERDWEEVSRFLESL